MIRRRIDLRRTAGDVLAALAAIAVTTVVARSAEASAMTGGFVFLLVVLAVAVWRGFLGGILASVLASVSFSYYFLPPADQLMPRDAEGWMALTTFLVASAVSSQLVVTARARAREADARRREVEALLAERESFLAERAHYEALAESDALKTSLLRAVSHDLRTPLTAVRLEVEALRGALSHETAVAPILESMSVQVHRLTRRIDNLLALARLESGIFRPRPEPTPPADLFRSAREYLHPLLKDRRVDVRVADGCPDAFVDPSLAAEILVNLLENADAVAPAGSPLELQAGAGGADDVLLDVLDRGPGYVPASDVEASDTARKGLGLEIAQSLARASGGFVTLVGREGGGTIARTSLPAGPSPAPEEAQA
jgi:K+-sensing histidine kinase KdpD